MKRTQSNDYFKEAESIFPGGVNSPVRAFKAVGGNPLFIDHSQGAYLYDVDGNQFVDYVLSWGPMILGHARKEVLEEVCLLAPQPVSADTASVSASPNATILFDFLISISPFWCKLMDLHSYSIQMFI